MYTLGQAARATGKAKVTLARAIQSGRISAAKSGDGSYTIDPAELHRVYPPTGEPAGDMKQSVTPNGPVAAPGTSAGEVAALRELLAEREETIRDLRARLDHEAEERRTVQVQLTALLTAPTKPAEPEPPRPLGRRILAWQHVWRGATRPWWQRWFR